MAEKARSCQETSKSPSQQLFQEKQNKMTTAHSVLNRGNALFNECTQSDAIQVLHGGRLAVGFWASSKTRNATL